MAHYLLDTHILLWIGIAPEKLSPKVRKIVSNEDNTLLLSLASIWEISIKKSLGRLELPCELREFTEKVMLNARIEFLPIDFSHTLEVEKLPYFTGTKAHNDPFDRLLVAQAKKERLTLLSKDKALREYGVKVVW